MERYFSTDVLADILRRLPPSSRRQARLVCRHWRDVVNSRTTEMQSRASPLIWDPSSGVAYIIDDLSSAGAAAGSCRPLWRNAAKRLHYGDSAVQLVGTCNGLLCLCDNEERAGGAVTDVNPATGEALAVPALPCAAQLVGRHITQTKWSEAKAWHEAYGFAYHPTTGKYKVVHVPCSYERVCEFDAVHVLTLGEATWREVPVHAGPGCLSSASTRQRRRHDLLALGHAQRHPQGRGVRPGRRASCRSRRPGAALTAARTHALPPDGGAREARRGHRWLHVGRRVGSGEGTGVDPPVRRRAACPRAALCVRWRVLDKGFRVCGTPPTWGDLFII
ncbi:uncharacterized protein [Aegilops tauschii subsp. strangulata]|uniref:uncharacterized protein n=1 Tax=Aegilops tauschii subsp. strangulata TaxID=200361 RepID=UPI003CC862A3